MAFCHAHPGLAAWAALANSLPSSRWIRPTPGCDPGGTPAGRQPDCRPSRGKAARGLCGTLATLTYWPHGAINTLLNGCAGSGCTNVQQTYDYNNRLQPVRIQLGTAGTNNENSCLVYNYYSEGVSNPPSQCAIPAQGTGNNGNLMGYLYQDNTNPTQGHAASYTYDPLNRLTFSTATGNKTQHLDFSYDPYGNMRCVTDGDTNGPCPNWTFDTATNRINTSGYGYDAAGNVIQDGTPQPPYHTYQWNGEGKLKSVNNPDQVEPCPSTATACMTYNALGQRAEQVDKGPERQYEYLYHADGRESGVWYTVQGGWYPLYLWAGGRLFGQYYGSSTDFIHQNHLGSTSQVTNQTGAVVEDTLLYPWGQPWAQVGSNWDNRYAGMQWRNFQTGLDPTPNRMYSWNQGRWLSPDEYSGGPVSAYGPPDSAPPGPLPYADILNPQSLNKYQYAYNNPMRYIDPTGRYGEDVHMDLTGALAVAAGFTQLQAGRIAAADEGVDTSLATSPLTAPYGYHFTDDARRNALWSTADRTGSSRDLGVALHAEQDSLSHEGISPWEHLLIRGRAPDITANDPIRADRMAAQTFGLLVRAAQRSSGTVSPVPWKEIRGLVWQFNRATDANAKRAILARLRQRTMQLRERSPRENCSQNPRGPGCGP